MDDKFELISISELIGILMKRKKLIALVTIGFLILGILSLFVFTKQRYTSELSLEINNIESTVTKQQSLAGPMYNLLESITGTDDMKFEDYLKEIKSDEVIKKTIKDLNLEDKYTMESLKNDLSVSSDDDLKIIYLRILSGDPEEGAKIINKIEENFSKRITSISQKNIQETLEVLEKQMNIEKEKYSESLKEYENAIKENSSAYEFKLELDAVYDQVTGYKLSLNDLEIKRAGIVGALEKSTSSGGDVILRPSGSDSYVYSDSSKKALEVDLAETEARTKSTETTIKSLQDKIKDLKMSYQEEIGRASCRERV